MRVSSSSLRIPCCIDVPEVYVARARYALGMLLYPFRVEPRWVTADRLDGGGVYYGVRPDTAPECSWRIGVLQETINFFSGTKPRPASERLVNIDGDDVPILFEASFDGPFDLVAATFFFLSGWQELHSTVCDEHGRFPYSESIQFKLDNVTVPIVDLYRTYAAHRLRKMGFEVEPRSWKDQEWAFCPTHDIDYVWKWRPGILYREIAQRGLMNREKEALGIRARRIGSAIAGVLNPSDPYRRAIRRMRREVRERDGTATFFFKTAARDPHDVKYQPSQSFLVGEYSELRAARFEIGLHPSYHAYNHGDYLKDERETLAAASGIQATSVRTHYLRFDWSVTPALMERSGFQIDSSLGFSEHEGFRNGTCRPFQMYDLKADRALDLWEMPLTMMESTLFNRRKLTQPDAVEQTVRLMETCKRFGGVFVGLWHNTLWDEQDCPGWGEHFTTSLDRATAANGWITSLQFALDSWR